MRWGRGMEGGIGLLEWGLEGKREDESQLSAARQALEALGETRGGGKRREALGECGGAGEWREVLDY